jgi:hypothetical protein
LAGFRYRIESKGQLPYADTFGRLAQLKMTWPFNLVVILQECWVVGLELPPEKQKSDLTRAITFQKIIHSVIHVNLLLPPPSSIAIVVAIKPEAVEEERGETGGVLGVLINKQVKRLSK